MKKGTVTVKECPPNNVKKYNMWENLKPFPIDPKYSDVLNGLKWAIPLFEAQNDPEVIKNHKITEKLVKQQSDKELKQMELEKRKALFKIV